MAINQGGALTQYSASIDWITSIDEGVTATGTNHATGYDITERTTRVTGGTASTADHVSLPEFATLTYQNEFVIFNDSSIDINIAPETGDDIGNGVGVDYILYPGEFAAIKILDKGASGIGKVVDSLDDLTIVSLATSTTLTSSQMYGTHFDHITALHTATLPPAVAGMNFTGEVSVAAVVKLDPDASEVINLNGSALTGGFTIDSDGTVDCVYAASCRVAGTWNIRANGFSAGS